MNANHEPKLYAKRDTMAQGEHYLRHVSAMTGEGLHAKSNIAAELAHRDIEIEQLRCLYQELLFAVGNKHPGETRHQTALRYIQQAEAPNYSFGEQGGGLTTCDMHDDESH